MQCLVFLSLYLDRTTDDLANNSNGGAGHLHLIQETCWLLPKRAWRTGTISSSRVDAQSAALGLRWACTNLCFFSKPLGINQTQVKITKFQLHVSGQTGCAERLLSATVVSGFHPIMQKGNGCAVIFGSRFPSKSDA